MTLLLRRTLPLPQRRLQLTKIREDRPGKASGLCADLPERRLEESFLVSPSKGEEDGFRWNSDPQSQTKAQARQALANINRKDALFMPLLVQSCSYSIHEKTASPPMYASHSHQRLKLEKANHTHYHRHQFIFSI